MENRSLKRQRSSDDDKRQVTFPFQLPAFTDRTEEMLQHEGNYINNCDENVLNIFEQFYRRLHERFYIYGKTVGWLSQCRELHSEEIGRLQKGLPDGSREIWISQ